MIDDGTKLLERLGGVHYVAPTGRSKFMVVFKADSADWRDLIKVAELTKGIRKLVLSAKAAIGPNGFCVHGRLRTGGLGESHNLPVINFFMPDCDYVAGAKVHVVRKDGDYAGTRVTITLPADGPVMPSNAVRNIFKVEGVNHPEGQDNYSLSFVVVNPDRAHVLPVLEMVAKQLRIYVYTTEYSDDDPRLADIPDFNRMPGVATAGKINPTDLAAEAAALMPEQMAPPGAS